MEAFYHSVTTFGTVDGPGIRYVLFLNGCQMSCCFCHNPDTWIMSGKTISVSEVMRDLLQYRAYYDKSQGGLTVTGGEPLLQPDFVAELFSECHRQGIHTVLDTGGFAATSSLEKVLPATDLVMFSLKSADRVLHKKLTGRDNTLILENLYLAAKSLPLILRYIIIPGITDTAEQLLALIEIIKKLPPAVTLDLLPYHSLGKAKWLALHRNYELADQREATQNDLNTVKAYFKQQGMQNSYVS